MIIDLIQLISRCTMEKKKEGHSFNQTIASSFFFAALAKTKAA